MSENGDYQDNSAEFQRDRYIEIYVEARQPELLAGLEELLRLGLISSEQVEKIARQRLSCALSLTEIVPSISGSTAASNLSNPPQTPVVATATVAHALQRVWQSFLDELSIRWLLFLGIFLVLVSSGVLAANQWQNFPGLGQYLVLFVYTLGFWGIGFWTGKQGLNLTSQTLTAIAILLVPINCWAINHLGLGSNFLGGLIIAFVVITLTTTSYLALPRQKNLRWLRLLFFLLSLLHFGWHLPHGSLLAIYGGLGVICWTHYQLLLSRGKYPLVDLCFVLVAWTLLLARSLIGSTYSWPQYCLAIAIFAWLGGTIYLSQARKTQVIALKHKSIAMTNSFLGRVAQICCVLLLVFSWLISINAGILNSAHYFWQTVGISFLGLHFFSQRLSLYWRKWDLTALFFLGAQTFYVCKELIPAGWRNQVGDFSLAISKTEYFPESLFGVTLFPYVLLTVLFSSWLYQRQKNQLALYSEYLTLMLGIVLACLSAFNPTWRSLNLLLSTLTLGYVARIRRPTRSGLVYFTHLLGLITLGNGIALVFPGLEQSWWGVILLGLMTLEWGVYLAQMRQKRNPVTTATKQSCWYFGLLLSTFSYTCFSAANSAYWGLLWLLTPLMLSLIAKYTPNIRQRRLGTFISCIALILIQLLVFRQGDTRLMGLIAAPCLMFINTFNLRRLSVTTIHLGLAIALIANLFELIMGSSLQDYRQWLLISNLLIFLLFLLRRWLLKTSESPQFGYISQRTAFGILGVGREAQNFKLVSKYLQSANYWAIVLVALNLIIVSGLYFSLPRMEIDQYFGHYLFTSGLLIAAIYWRYRGSPNNLVLYTITWLGAIFAGGLIRLVVSSSFALATTNILLGLIALIIVVLIAQSNTPWASLNLSYTPLIYAALGIFWRLSFFNSYTGLLTLGAALILINTQQSHQQINRLVKYLGFVCISGGIYEVVIYQMHSLPRENTADSLTILSLVAIAIAFGYRLLFWWYGQREYPALVNFPLSQVMVISHIHWGAGSILQMLAMVVKVATNTSSLTVFEGLSLSTGLCLGAYALIQGREIPLRNVPPPAGEENHSWWVYIGLGEIIATIVYGRLIFRSLSRFDPWWVMLTCAVAWLIEQTPWQQFGWRRTPWQVTALILPITLVLITAKNISDFSLLIAALFYLHIAYARRNIRWSYLSLALVNWLALDLVQEADNSSLLIAGMISLAILYLAQFDPALQNRRHLRHYLRLLGSSIFCLVALFEQPGIISGAIAFGLIFLGLGVKVRAFLYTGTITLILTVLYQLIILVFTYSFLKWVVGLITGISSIAIAAGFEKRRDHLSHKLQAYREQLHHWQ